MICCTAVTVCMWDSLHLPSSPGLSSLSPAALTCSSLLGSHGPLRPGNTQRHRKRKKEEGQISTVSWIYHESRLHTSHTFTSASTWCSRMGLLQNSTSGLGTLSVSGRSRVPYPPTRIKAFMLSAFSNCYQGNQSSSITKQQTAWAGKSVTGCTVSEADLFRIICHVTFYRLSFSTQLNRFITLDWSLPNRL